MFGRLTRSTIVGVAALALVGMVGSCTNPLPDVPTDMISVPGSHTFVTTTDIYGRDVPPQGTVAFCLDAPTRLLATTSGDSLRITFGDQTYSATTNLFASASPLETPVLGPGCGLLRSALFRTLEGTVRSMTVWLEPIP